MMQFAFECKIYCKTNLNYLCFKMKNSVMGKMVSMFPHYDYQLNLTGSVKEKQIKAQLYVNADCNEQSNV